MVEILFQKGAFSRYQQVIHGPSTEYAQIHKQEKALKNKKKRNLSTINAHMVYK